MLLALIMAATLPSADAEALGRRLAAVGAFQTMLPMVAKKETEEMIAAHPDLSPAERDRLRAVARGVMERGSARIAAGIGHEYAATLSLDDLKALVAFNESPVAQRYRSAMPAVTMKGLAAAGQIDFKGDVAKAFCAETGKLCGR